MAKNIPTSAVGLKAGSKAKAVGSIQTYLEEFGYLESEEQPFEHDEVFMRTTADDHILDGPLSATPGVLDDSTIEALKRFQEFAGPDATGDVDEATRAKMNLARCGVPDVLFRPQDSPGDQGMMT